MAKKLQLRRGTTSQHSSFTGAVGEVTVDTEKKVVVVHDGSTAGGVPLATATAVALNTAKATNVTTNLSVTANGTSLTVASSDGTDASLPLADTNNWGVMSDEMFDKLDGIAAGATANAGDAVLATDQIWTGAQRGAVTALSSSSNSTAVDFNSGNNFSLTLGENSTLAQPSNQVAGQSGSIFVTQDGTGGRTLNYHTDWKWVGGSGSQPTVTATANAVSRIDYIVAGTNKVHAVASLDVK